MCNLDYRDSDALIKQERKTTKHLKSYDSEKKIYPKIYDFLQEDCKDLTQISSGKKNSKNFTYPHEKSFATKELPRY